MSGPEVRKLQQLLNQLGFTVAPAGQPGSYGMETDYFGPSTQAALQRFQAANGIVSSGNPTSTGYGNLGPQTLQRLNASLTSGGASNAGPGTASAPPPVDPKKVGKRYGYEINTAAENRAVAALDGFMNLLSTGAAGDTGISKKQMNKIMNDDSLVAFYVNALAYGGYTLQDVYKDMLREELGGKAAHLDPISATIEAPAYKASAEYDEVENSPLFKVSPTIAGLDSFVTTMPVLQMPDEAFSQLKPLPDPDSPEFRAEMEKYKSATYEVALQVANAQNEVEHTRALTAWDNLKNEIQDRLGITLANNAVAAWNQINAFQNQAAQNGIAGSGIEAREIDRYLRQQMASNARARGYYDSTEEKAEMEYYQNFASPAEIAALPADKREKWGLTPDQATRDYLTIKNLKKQFPDTPEEDLQALIDKYIDPSGNLLSKLYGNYASSKYDTREQYKLDQGTKVILAHQNEAAEELKKFSDPNNPFLKPEGKMETNQKPTDGKTEPLKKKETPATKSTSSSGIDYTFRPGETVAQYNARIEAARRGQTTYTSSASAVPAPKAAPAPVKAPISTPAPAPKPQPVSSGGYTPVPSSGGMSIAPKTTTKKATVPTSPFLSGQKPGGIDLISSAKSLGSSLKSMFGF